MRPPWRWPSAILAGALAFRLLLFTGIQGNDDRYYFASALRLSRGERPAVRDLFDTRVGLAAPVAVLFSLFGPREACLVAPNVVASLGLVALAWLWGRRRYSERVGVGAALFVAIVPLDVFYATASFTDQPVAAWLGLGAFLIDGSHEGSSRGRRLARSLLAGLCFGAAHLTKESSVLLLVALLPLLLKKDRWKDLAIAGAALAAVIGLEMVVYGLKEADPLYRVHLAHHYQSASHATPDGFLKRLFALPSFCLNPLDPIFPYSGGLLAFSCAGAAWAFRRDRVRSGGVACWWLGTGLLLALSPMTLSPYRPALELQPRMFAALVLPGSLLAAAFLVEVAAPLRPKAALAAAAVAALLALLCAARIHQDGVHFRAGPEWAHRRLVESPGASVVTDPRTAVMLQVFSAGRPVAAVVGFEAGDPPPAPGTLLLDCGIQASAALRWDGAEPPPWWTSPLPAREVVAELRMPAPWRLRGARGPEERTVLRRISDHSPR